jgi:hypothetical protein
MVEASNRPASRGVVTSGNDWSFTEKSATIPFFRIAFDRLLRNCLDQSRNDQANNIYRHLQQGFSRGPLPEIRFSRFEERIEIARFLEFLMVFLSSFGAPFSSSIYERGQFRTDDS